MFRTKPDAVFILVVGLGLFPFLGHPQETIRSEREAMYYRYLEFPSYVKGGSIEPHWMADGSSFWYAEGAPANTVIYKVDPQANTKTRLFDATRLREALTATLGHEPPYQGLPFEEFTFVDKRERVVKFTIQDREFILQLDSYEVTRPAISSDEEKSRFVPQSLPEPFALVKEEPSPDGLRFLGVKEYNLWLRSPTENQSAPLTDDGIEDYEWGVRGAQWTLQQKLRWAWWSADGSKVAVKKRDYRNVQKIPIVHWLEPREGQVEWVRHSLPGKSVAQTEIYVIDILSKNLIRVETGDKPDQQFHIIGWRPDGSELLFLRVDREFKELDLVAANPTSGSTRVVLTESAETFVIAWGFEPYIEAKLFNLLNDGKRFIWMSERDGWRHFFLYCVDGTLIRRLTRATYPVVQIVAVDEKAGWVYFTAHSDQQRPYDTHLYRVNLKGKGLRRLSEGRGQHKIQFSPSMKFFVDTHSSVDRPPVVELRKADGTFLQALTKANVDALTGLQWRPPEEFVVKAADGKTDLYGVLYKPYDFNPKKKYPVIEVIYAGPQFSEVPHTFTQPHGVDFHAEHGQALAQLGFIVFVVDGRGTPERGKAFQDVVYGNLGRHEIPDHVATLKQLAEKRPYMDLSRVGIFGWSFGGYFTIRAMLLAPDVYQVGIAGETSVGLFDSYVEAYMRQPENNKEGYDYMDNRHLVDNLKGKLLIIVGTSDAGAFMGSMKLLKALVEAEKPYDLIVLPEQGHRPSGMSRTYVFEAIHRYFQEHLKP